MSTNYYYLFILHIEPGALEGFHLVYVWETLLGKKIYTACAGYR